MTIFLPTMVDSQARNKFFQILHASKLRDIISQIQLAKNAVQFLQSKEAREKRILAHVVDDVARLRIRGSTILIIRGESTRSR